MGRILFAYGPSEHIPSIGIPNHLFSFSEMGYNMRMFYPSQCWKPCAIVHLTWTVIVKPPYIKGNSCWCCELGNMLSNLLAFWFYHLYLVVVNCALVSIFDAFPYLQGLFTIPTNSVSCTEHWCALVAACCHTTCQRLALNQGSPLFTILLVAKISGDVGLWKFQPILGYSQWCCSKQILLCQNFNQ